MVVRIKTGKSVKGALNYNELKVRQGKAQLLLAAGFSCEVDDLTFSQKLRRFTKLTERNDRIKTNSVHISLNFPPDEVLENETLQRIAADYMERIGFGNQPYLVYRHSDANHPHIHIITTSIQSNGKPIKMHNIGKLKSEPARKELEEKYGLIPAETRKRLNPFQPTPAELKEAKYGKTETKQTISNIVREVAANYKYTSLEELNSILRLYNVTAYRGAVGSRQYQNRGLSYYITDKYGYRQGNAIKASSIYTSPTLKNLEKNFQKNKVKKIPYKKYVQAKVDAIAARAGNIESLIAQLEKRNIHCHFDRNDHGDIQSIYFIDPFNRTIYKTEELGYTMESLFSSLKRNKSIQKGHTSTEQFKMNISIQLVKSLLTVNSSGADLDPEFEKKKKKRKKGR